MVGISERQVEAVEDVMEILGERHSRPRREREEGKGGKKKEEEGEDDSEEEGGGGEGKQETGIGLFGEEDMQSSLVYLATHTASLHDQEDQVAYDEHLGLSIQPLVLEEGSKKKKLTTKHLWKLT